jgi:hypothetical protein
VKTQNTLIISQQITFKEYLLLNYYFFYKSKFIIFITIVGFISFTSIFSEQSFFPEKPYYLKSEFIFGFSILFGLPFIVFFNSRANYKNKYSKILNYEFDLEKINIISETSTYSQNLIDLYKIKETNKWIIIYLNKKNVIFISKQKLVSTNNFNNLINLFPDRFNIKISNQTDDLIQKKYLSVRISGYLLTISSVILLLFILLIYITLFSDNHFKQTFDLFTGFLLILPVVFLVWMFYIGNKMVKKNK